MKTLPGYTEVKTLDFVVKISNSIAFLIVIFELTYK
jgi:hypothetical protein